MQSGKIEEIWTLLDSVPDPEIPVISVVELGVIRDVKFVDNEYIISVTPTYSGCPAVKTFQDDIKIKLKKNNIPNFKIDIVYKPAWTTEWMSKATKDKLMNASSIEYIYILSENSFIIFITLLEISPYKA